MHRVIDRLRLDGLDDLERDVAHTLRTLARNPTFTIVAVLTLALGIGATTAVYSTIDAAFFRPLPFPEPEQLVRLRNVQVPIDPSLFARQVESTPSPKLRFDVADLYPWRDLFEQVAAYAQGNRNLGTGPEPLRADVTFVTTEFFATIGRDAALGRLFTPEETVPGGPNVTVLSDRLWRIHFGGDPEIVGKTVTLDDVRYEVLGVMPAGFEFPARTELWTPLPMPAPMSILTAFRNYLPSNVIARLADGVTPNVARERLEALGRELLAAPPPEESMTTPDPVVPLQRYLVGDRGTTLTVLMASAALVLLIACANAATLLLSRASARSREIATHAVLGATRARLLRRLLVESVILALGGAVLGLVMAKFSLATLSALMPSGLAGLAPLELDSRVLAFALGVTIVTGLVFGIWPAFGASRVHLGEALKSAGSRVFAGSGRTHRVLVVVQVALACLLVIGAALMLTTLRSLLATDVGMRVQQVATARLKFSSDTPAEAPSRAAFVESVVARLNDAPGVEVAAAINTLPLAQEPGVALRVDTASIAATPELERPFAPYLVVSPGYFRTLGIDLLAGRDLAWTDGPAERVAVINRTLAEQLWPGQDAVGQRIEFVGPARTVVGVVADARISDLGREAGPQVYLSIMEQTETYLSIVARAADDGDTAPLAAQIRDAVRAVDPALPVYGAQPMEAVIATSLAPRRLNTLLIGAFGALALSLAAIGLYGVLSYSVARRTREIGIRMALGAPRGAVLTFVIRQGLTLVALGIVLGIAAAAAATRYIEGMLYGVAARDPMTFAAVALLFLIVGVAAAWVPARQAAAADPLTALRHE